MNTLDRIKQLMEQRGWTVYRLAKESGLNQSTLTNMFNRSNDPSISTLESLCKGFGITMLQFFSDETSEAVLTAEQLELLGGWSRLNSEQKKAIMLLIDNLDESR